MKPLLYILLIIIALVSCKKEEVKSCWQLIDQLGNDVMIICDKTEAEMKAAYQGNCMYHKEEDQKFCWLTSNGDFIKNASESRINHYKNCFNLGSATKVACDYCDKYFSREKRTYKPNNSISYTAIKYKFYCGDSVNLIRQQRQFIRKDDADSLIIIQFSLDGSNW
jgi:hypothetical protein